MSDMFGREVSGFCSHANARVEGAAEGPLKGLTFGVKDIIDVAGLVTGGGNAEWFRTHEPAPANAPVVQALLDAGATMAGKTITEEFAFGMIGENFHYGTPRNAAAPGHIPGGSSSGSASISVTIRTALCSPPPTWTGKGAATALKTCWWPFAGAFCRLWWRGATSGLPRRAGPGWQGAGI